MCQLQTNPLQEEHSYLPKLYSPDSIKKPQLVHPDFEGRKLFNGFLRVSGISGESCKIVQLKKRSENYDVSFSTEPSSIISILNTHSKVARPSEMVDSDVAKSCKSYRSPEINHWFKPKPLKLFKKSPPSGLAEKVKKHLDFIKNTQEHEIGKNKMNMVHTLSV
jgi:hypothetical protein